MKRKFLVFGLFAASALHGFGQQTINPYTRKKISRSSIRLVYANYLQDGNHSAVTGGAGTEKLNVYAPEFIIQRQVDSLNSYSVDVGVDVISSASTDRIDYMMSSASKVDLHTYITAGYGRTLKHHRNVSWDASGYFSIESDYLSAGGILSTEISNKRKMQSYTGQLEVYLDDLRWGRLNGEHLTLVYPVELRDREWLSSYRRRSYILSLGFEQIITQRTLIAIYPGIGCQQGQLATPFHRVYFTDSTERVENVPGERLKIPVAVQLNTFLGNRTALSVFYRFYHDDFGISAHTFSAEATIKLNAARSVAPLVRVYTQKAASFFRPYGGHNPQQEFYSSDYDLSSFQSIEAGITARFARSATGKWVAKGLDNAYLNAFEVRYLYYYRSDGLHAHTITALFDFISGKKHGHALPGEK